MNIGTIQNRGQLVLPKGMRDLFGLTPGMPVSFVVEDDGVKIKPLISDSRVIKPKYTREEYMKVLKRVSKDIENYGPLWTKKDDRLMAILKKKDEERDKRLNW